MRAWNLGKRLKFDRAISYKSLKETKAEEIKKLREVYQQDKFIAHLEHGTCEPLPAYVQMFQQSDLSLEQVREAMETRQDTLEGARMTREQALTLLDASLITMALHTESRIASLLGQGFYTIGPCGEELLSAVGSVLRPTDPMSLHYRHISVQIARQLSAGRTIQDVLLDRARGYVVSVKDPACAAVHCAIGGGEYDFLLTSTLASQALPAVGRALGNSLSHLLNIEKPKFQKSAISYVSVGDGSVNHSHFLSGVNLAEYVAYRNFKAPVLFGISDNNICISLRGYNWLANEWIKKLRMPCYLSDGRNIFDIWKQTREAENYVRGRGKPATLVFQNLTRRFGHAATDRQFAYFSEKEILEMEEKNPVAYLVNQLVAGGIITYEYAAQRFQEIRQILEDSFEVAVNEPKITSRESLLQRNSAPLVPVNHVEAKLKASYSPNELHPMRKHMTEVIDEMLAKYTNLVYIGEDVTHGGYYLVTDGLAKKYPFRVADFPPEEAGLLGCAIGYAQAGLIPVVEVPYAKYLDCGADIFFEAIYAHWYSNGRQPNGMIIRLQGFGRGVFGGNFHTHNSLYLPPGLDVVCYSNGADYAKGFRYAVEQARGGRVVMLVDCTNLLNLRHLHTEGDRGWLFPYSKPDEYLTWDKVRTYGEGKKLAIVCYGNSVIQALNAMQVLEKEHGRKGEVTVIDCPYLSSVPRELEEKIPEFEAVLFADDCKAGQHPFAGFVHHLQSKHILQKVKWLSVAAQPTYNPLGTPLTFTNMDDILGPAKELLGV